VKDYLDIREINGYSIQYTPFHSATPAAGKESSIHCLVYIGLPDNPQFMGPQDPQELAEHILRSEGPSGLNKEYLYMLEEALDGLSEASADEHVRDLAARCRALESADTRSIAEGAENATRAVLHTAGSTEEQEEVEKK
jgi:cation transport regulator ChaC